MKRVVTVSALFVSLVAVPARAIAGVVVATPITAGNLLSNPNEGFQSGTAIAIGAPVTGDGALDTVTFGWTSAATCSAVKIKVFRFDGTNLNFIAERGPIPVTWNSSLPDATTAALSPTIAVHKGDWLGIAGANSGDCGSPLGLNPGAGTTATFSSDVTSTVSASSATILKGLTLDLFATGLGNGEVFAGVLPGAGSGPGAQNSHFKTGVQVTNPFFDTIHGRLVFHPAGASASANDPSLGFSIDPGNSAGIDDIVAAMGLAGLCSIDVYVGAEEAIPVIVTRIFNDAGAAGTTGFTEPLFDPSKITGGTGVSVTGVLITPPDTTRYRFNVGIRTIGGPVGVSITVKDHHGNVVHTFSHTYASDSFNQVSVHDFLGGFDPDPDDTILVTYSNGRAIIYGATTDNVTNDPSVQFMPYLSAIA
jgi:hypothetical protein